MVPEESKMTGDRYTGDDDDDKILNGIDDAFEQYEKDNPDPDKAD